MCFLLSQIRDFISQKRTGEDYSLLSCSIFTSHKCIMDKVPTGRCRNLLQDALFLQIFKGILSE